jgi:hypothetical protein
VFTIWFCSWFSFRSPKPKRRRESQEDDDDDDDEQEEGGDGSHNKNQILDKESSNQI